MSSSSLPHPLDQLSIAESEKARQIVISTRGRDTALQFRSIHLEEPLKHELFPFLEAENAGKLTVSTFRPARVARIQYDVIKADKTHEYTESLVDINSGRENVRVVDKKHQASITG